MAAPLRVEPRYMTAAGGTAAPVFGNPLEPQPDVIRRG